MGIGLGSLFRHRFVDGYILDVPPAKEQRLGLERPLGSPRRALLRSGDYGERDEERTAGSVRGEDG